MERRLIPIPAFITKLSTIFEVRGLSFANSAPASPLHQKYRQLRDFAAAERYKAGILAFTQQGNHQKNTAAGGD